MPTLLEYDLKHVLHPCSQMQDYEWLKPLIIERAEGAYFYLQDGRHVIDAISSWWCKSFGHQHPVLKSALLQQLNRFEHVIFANTTNDVIVELTKKLLHIAPYLSHVFYAGDGSCAVEVAMKMSLHVRHVRCEKKRTRFIALQNGYHGETLGALSVSDVQSFKTPYQSALFAVDFIKNLPYVTGIDDPLWHDCSDYWEAILPQLLPLTQTATAILLEPIVQGAGGMLIYSPDFLKRLAAFAKAHDIHLIADEIMTGLGRTGKMLACEWADIKPDMICLSKGLTSGWLPFSAVLFSDNINNHFGVMNQKDNAFLHSHTYSGNALGAAIANAVLDLLNDDTSLFRINAMGDDMRQLMQQIANQTGQLHKIRQLGAIVAADLQDEKRKKPHRYAVFQSALAHGAFLRPLGSTLYWLPPFITTPNTLKALADITLQAINEVMN